MLRRFPTAHVAALAVFLFLATASGFAQTAPRQVISGTVVTLTNAVTGRQLSAALPESLTTSPNSGGWEQWTYAPSALTSFHGTRLIIDGQNAFHSAFFSPSETMINTFEVPTNNIGTLDGGRVLISTGGNSYLSDTGASVVAQFAAQASAPANAYWIIRIVPAPAPNRQGDKEAICGGITVPTRSVHGTYLSFGDNGRVFQGPFVGGVSTPTIGTHDTITCQNEPLRFGQSVIIKLATIVGTTKGGAYMKPVTQLANGTWTMAWKFLDSAHSRYTIVPIAPYTNGARVPRNVQFFLRSDSFPLLNLSASGNLKDVSLVPSVDLWEKWEFVRQP